MKMSFSNKRWIFLLITLNEALSRLVEAEASLSRLLEYSIYEELETGTVVGDVRSDSNIAQLHTEDEALLLRFSFKQSLSNSRRLFTIDESQGIIRTAGVLDRDTLCAASATSCDFALDVTVKPLRYVQIVKVVVHLVDVNDNAPTFPSSRVTVGVAETARLGALFPLPVAEDADSGRFGVQEYQLLSDSDVFELKVSDQVDRSKDVRLRLAKGIDRESVGHYDVTLLALDGGSPPKSGSIFIDIIVVDANDNSPKFHNSSYEVSVGEDAPVMTTLLRVQASDPDEGTNGMVVYGFSDQTNAVNGGAFGIDNATGAIYLKAPLDYERVQTIQLTVKAGDRGTGSLPVFAKVTVHVTDVNDNPPRITVNVLTSSGRAEVAENADRGAFVAHVAVKDDDVVASGGQVDCSIAGGGRDLFRLEPLFQFEYKMVTAVTFDREDRDVHSVRITCSDNGDPPLSSTETIDVFVTDDNDHSPQMSLPLYEVFLPENTAPGAFVTQIEASDEDSGKNGALRYRISSVDPTAEGVLTVNAMTGRVATNVAFNYEDRRQYAFLVTASDQGDEARTSTATLVLHVQDVNDERPTFDRSVYHFSTRENLPAGTVLGRVSATDRDASPEFRDVFYRLRFPSDSFEVDKISGEVMTLRRLDREVDPVHRLTVIAANRGGSQTAYPAFEERVNVTVTVEDENDNAPVFTFPTALFKTVQLSGTSANVGLTVTRVAATDPDFGTNARISYELLHGNDDGLFEMDPSTGIVTMIKSPHQTSTEPGTNRIFRLTVAARDSGSPPMASVADLVVLINNTAGPNYAAHEADGDGGSPFDGNKVPIVVGAVLGSLFVAAFVVVAGVFLHRHRRTATQKITSPVVCEQLRPLSRAAKHSCRSLNTVDTASMSSSAGSRDATLAGPGTGAASSCRQCRAGNASTGGSMVLPLQNVDDDDQDDDLDRVPSHWPLRPAQSLRVPKVECNFDQYNYRCFSFQVESCHYV